MGVVLYMVFQSARAEAAWNKCLHNKNIYQSTPLFLYVEMKCQLDATEVFICRSYCLLNMFRASLCPSSGVQEYYTVVAACGIFCCGFSSSWSGVELRVMRPVCRMLVYQHPANRTHNPQLHTRPATWKTTAQNTTRSNHCIILWSSWWWAWWCPKHVEQAIRSAIKTSVASRWHFISTCSY